MGVERINKLVLLGLAGILFLMLTVACGKTSSLSARCAPKNAVVFAVLSAAEVAAQPDIGNYIRNETNDAQAAHPTGQVGNCTNGSNGPNPGGLAIYVIL